MKNAKLVLFALSLLLGVSMSCKFLGDKARTMSGAPKVDFTTPANGLNVKVDLDKKQTSSGKIGNAGGSVSLNASDGSKFTLDVPADALDADTTITMTALKSIEGSALGSTTPVAVQLEPSGLKLKQAATLTITPAKEISVKDQIVFGYEADGKDYHLAPVDPKSKEIRVRLLGFSGAGVGSGSDSAWAAHLAIEAGNASTRLLQKLGEATQAERRKILIDGDESGSSEDIYKSFIDAFMDQVILKEIAAAELDCKHAQKALDDLIFIERLQQLLGLADSSTGSASFLERSNRLQEIGKKCMKPYRVNGTSSDVEVNGEICSLGKPFVFNAKFPGGTGKIQFNPASETGGTLTESGGGSGCTYTGSGSYSVSVKDDGSGTIDWTTTAKLSCPGFGNSRTVTFSLPLQPAPDLACP